MVVVRSVDSEVIPPIDPTILVDLENKAKLLSENLDCVNKNFITHLHDVCRYWIHFLHLKSILTLRFATLDD